MNSLRDADMLHTKYEEIKTHLPGIKFLSFTLSSLQKESLINCISSGFVTKNSLTAASNKNFPNELRTTLDLLKSDIAKNKECNLKHGKSLNCSDAAQNQGRFRNYYFLPLGSHVLPSLAGVIRRKIVSASFKSQSSSRRMPARGRSGDIAWKESTSSSQDS